MTQAQFLVLNSFYLRFSSLVLHFYGSIPPLSVKFLPSKVLLNVCPLQSDNEPAVYEVQLVCKFLSALYYTVTLWASTQAEQPLAAAVRTCQSSMHTVLCTSVLSIYLTTDKKKITILQRVAFSFGVYWKSLHYFFHSTYQGMPIAIAFIFINYWQDPYQTERTLINIKIISYIVMSNFYLNFFLWVIKIALWM